VYLNLSLIILFCQVSTSLCFGQEINSQLFDNLYEVSDSLYRSEQPSKKGMIHLESIGINTVLNLRKRTTDKKEASNTKLVLLCIPINAWKMNQDDLMLALKSIQSAKKPIVVHCLHGADRTGVVIAAYRMIFENLSKEKAIEEFLDPQFGFHAKWFPKMIELLQNLDVSQAKKALKIN